MKTRLWCLIVALLLLAAPLGAQNPIMDSGSITAVSSGGACSAAPAGCAVFTLPNGVLPSLTLQVSGTYVGTLLFEATSDGTNWKTITGISLADGSSATGTTTTGQFSFSNSGLTGIRVRCTAYTSGTAVVTAVRGYASARWLTPFLSSLTFTNGTALADTSGSGKLLITGTTPMLQLGVTTSSFPALLRNGASFDLRLADDSAYGSLQTGTLTVSSGNLSVTSGSYRLAGSIFAITTAPSAPTSCGTSPAVTASNGTVAFVITGGTGGVATGCSVTMPTAATGWNCNIVNRTAAAAHRANVWTVQTATTTTSITFEYQTVSTGAATAFTASDVFAGTCSGY